MELLRDICHEMRMLVPYGTKTLAALELGGIPIAVLLGFKLGIDLIFVRKEAKTYGTCKQVEGPSVKDKSIVIIEDVVTTGSAIIEAAEVIRSLGGEVDTAVCVVNRMCSGIKNLKEVGINLISLHEIKV
jgi:orotate phosphoribosyltransferase